MPKDRPEERLNDTRIVERFIEKGVVSDKDHERFLKNLPDLADKAETANVRLGTDEDVGSSH